MKFLLLTILFTMTAVHTFAQSKTIDDLNREKQKLQSIIEQNTKLIKDYANRRNSEMMKISVVDDQLTKRRSLIDVYKTEITAYNKQIKQLNMQIDSVENEVAKQKEEYAEMLRHMQSTGSSNQSPLAYILSSKSFNQSYRRFLFLKQYSNYRKEQFSRLSQSKVVLKSLKDKLTDKVSSTNSLISQMKNESRQLSDELIARQQNIDKIKQSQSDLQVQIEKAQAQTKQLEEKILVTIREEAEKARREAELARKNSKSPNNTNSTKNAEIKLSDDIIKNKGMLPWPVKSFVVTSYFGEHDHPLVPSIKIRNNGIDIDILASNAVHPVHKGKVSRIIMIPGSAASIIIRHGEILTVYSNFSQVNVKNGQEVDVNTNLGTIFNGDGLNSNILHFEIWHADVKQDPEQWLQKQ